MSETSDRPTRQERIDALLEAVFLRMHTTGRSGFEQGRPDWEHWAQSTNVMSPRISDGDEDLLRGLRAGLLEVCTQIDEVSDQISEVQNTLVEALRQERHERERLEERVKHLGDLLEESRLA